MNIIKENIVTFILILIYLLNNQMTNAETLSLCSKGWQATIIRIEGMNTSKAMAVGKVTYEDAKEYCERDPGGETKQYGGKLTIEQCIQKVLKKEKGKLYSASADCPMKKLTNHLGTFSLLGQVNDMNIKRNVWRDDITGNILDGSCASGFSVLDAQFELLCPAFINR